jgi:meso-butanediol dehydrogenase / (S,S)-butanediol dehydrogenase / diacetyl reductase
VELPSSNLPDGTTVVITGAGRGIGRACAGEFARRGAQVVAADIDGGSAAAVASAIGGFAVQVDVADPESVRSLVRQTMERFGAVAALVNNAAIQVNRTIEDTSPEEWARQMAVNVGGVFLCSKYFLPALRESRGAIVNMSSVNGFFVEPGCAG